MAWQGRLGRDYDVRLYGNDYSVDPGVIGQLVDVTSDLDRVLVRAGARVVANHTRTWSTAITITERRRMDPGGLPRRGPGT